MEPTKIIYEENTLKKTVICPYCQHEPDMHYVEEEETEFTCEMCDRIFRLQVEVAYRYTTSPDCELNNEEHEPTQWIQYNGEVSEHKICKKCGILV